MLRIDDNSYILEQGDDIASNGEQQRAWDDLILAHYDPRLYMYMNTSLAMGHESHAFKHRETRKYVYTRGNLRLQPRILGSSI